MRLEATPWSHTFRPQVLPSSRPTGADPVAGGEERAAGDGARGSLAPVATHNSVCSVNIGVLRRPFYRGRHAYDPVRNGLSGFLPVSASGLAGTGGAGSQTSGGRSPSAAARPGVASSRRPPALGLALSSLAALPEGDGAGQAGNRTPVASARIPQILALALKFTPRWAARRESRDS